MSFEGGIGAVTEAVAGSLGPRLKTRRIVDRIRRTGTALAVDSMSGGRRYRATAKPCGTLLVHSSMWTAATRAAGGPFQSQRVRAAIAAGSPAATTSTLPSGRFLTQPSSRNRAASCAVAAR